MGWQLHVAGSKGVSIIQRMGLQCGVVKSYEAVYGLYDLSSVGWQLHVAEFDGVNKLVY